MEIEELKRKQQQQRIKGLSNQELANILKQHEEAVLTGDATDENYEEFILCQQEVFYRMWEVNFEIFAPYE